MEQVVKEHSAPKHPIVQQEQPLVSHVPEYTHPFPGDVGAHVPRFMAQSFVILE